MTLLPKLTYLPPQYLILFVLATVPLLFGAIHPIIQSFYVALVLMGLGGWLLFFAIPKNPIDLISKRWLLPILILLVFTTFQSIPLPFSWVELLSPVRAERVHMVNMLAQSTQHFVSLSDQGPISLQQSILIFALLVYFFSLKVLFRNNDAFMHVIIVTITLVGIVEALYGLLQFLYPRVGILWLPSAAAANGTIIYKNQYAVLLNLCWPLTYATAVIYLKKFIATARIQSCRKQLRNTMIRLTTMNKEIPMYFFATVIMMLAVLFSLSRGGIIAMFLIFIALNFYLPISRKAKVILTGFIFFFILSYGILLGIDTVITRFSTLDESGAGRVALYLSSLQMLTDHWLTGIGLGSYTLLSPVYLKGFPPDIHFDRVHNEFLEFAIEFGIPATALFLGWLVSILVFAGKKLYIQVHSSVSEVRSTEIIGCAAFCSLLGFFIHGVADFGWRLPANLFYVVTLAAMMSFSLEIKKSKMQLFVTNIKPPE